VSKLYFYIKVHSVTQAKSVRGHKTTVAHVVLVLQFISNLTLCVYNAVDPYFFHGILTIRSSSLLIVLAVACMHASVVYFQFYWYRLTVKLLGNTNESCLKKHNVIPKLNIAYLIFIAVFYCFLYATQFIPETQIAYKNKSSALGYVLIPYGVFTSIYLVILITNGSRIHQLTKNSKTIPFERARKIAILMITSGLGMVDILVTAALFLFFNTLPDRSCWVYFGLCVVGQVVLASVNFAQISSFVFAEPKPTQVRHSTRYSTAVILDMSNAKRNSLEEKIVRNSI